ncbi:MAG TPA: DUF6265 family protein [Vicinamibacterales bacterium]|nr:DUF6265 family protein [Vicinamibacterales bacterium]
MRHAVGLVVMGIVAALGAASAAHQPRDFSGTWTAVKDAPSGVAAAPSPVFGARFALRHAGETLTLTRVTREVSIEAAFPLDGREVRTRLPGGTCQGDSYTLEAATREGEAIAFTTVGMIAPGGNATKLSVKRLFRLDAPDTLMVEGTMVQAGQSHAVATIYKRSAEVIAAPVASSAAKAAATIADVAWIGGVWVGGTNSTVEERWTPPSGGSMLAISRTMRNNAMSAFEFLCIVERNGGLVYTAMPNARTPPTDFTLTQLTPDSATFENPSHDYPRMIRYTRRPDGSLETTIAGEGGQRPQSVVLKKQ